MSRLEGNKPNTGLIFVAALIFALVAAGLFLAFRPVSEPPNVISNSVETSQESTTDSENSTKSASEINGELAPIVTPLPTATPTPLASPIADNAVAVPTVSASPRATTPSR